MTDSKAEDVVEVMARAFFESRRRRIGGQIPWPNWRWKEEFTDDMHAALAALSEAGYAVIRKDSEATTAMVAAAFGALPTPVSVRGDVDWSAVFNAMLAASPLGAKDE